MKKTIKIILIAIISIILLCVILGIVDYIRANNGKIDGINGNVDIDVLYDLNIIK